WRCGPSLLFCRKNGENKRRTVMQKNFTLSVLNIIQPLYKRLERGIPSRAFLICKLFVKFGIFVDQIMGFNCNGFVKNI
ncbi:hypothetical protein, partial [Ligilactobacillus salivarius]|uniref:hypothetical protein n=1 Tax=Ligilactobacillus salivarius TaxID=1624 RepID=UPI00195B9DF9